MYKQKQPNGGSYAITEQGDLGLGLTPINEEVNEDEEEKDKRKYDYRIIGDK